MKLYDDKTVLTAREAGINKEVFASFLYYTDRDTFYCNDVYIDIPSRKSFYCEWINTTFEGQYIVVTQVENTDEEDEELESRSTYPQLPAREHGRMYRIKLGPTHTIRPTRNF